MKQVKVDREKCSCCGACFTDSAIFAEDNAGGAVVVNCGIIREDEIPEISKIIEVCPSQAIFLIETDDKVVSKDDLKKIVNELKNKLEGIQIPDVKIADIKMNAKEIQIQVPYSYDRYQYIYSSEAKAESAGLAEFDKLAYSQAEKIVLQILIQYKINKLRKYYTSDEESYYVKKNQEFEMALKNIEEKIILASNGMLKLPNDFTVFFSLPARDHHDRELFLNILSRFEDGLSGRVMNEFHSNSYSSKSEYKMYLDTDMSSEYEGECFFGGDKYKYRYCYTGVNEAIKNLIGDLQSSVNYADVDEEAVERVNSVLKMYREDVAKRIEEKCNMLSKEISKI